MTDETFPHDDRDDDASRSGETDDGEHLAGDFPDDDFADDSSGVFETSAAVQCPYCGETCEIALDPAGGSVQQYVEDCQVCCQPWTVVVTFHATGQADVYIERADG